MRTLAIKIIDALRQMGKYSTNRLIVPKLFLVVAPKQTREKSSHRRTINVSHHTSSKQKQKDDENDDKNYPIVVAVLLFFFSSFIISCTVVYDDFRPRDSSIKIANASTLVNACEVKEFNTTRSAG